MSSFAEFFAGIGLVRSALEPLGWRCAFANDISEKKAEMYRHSFGGDDLAVKDIREIKASDLPEGLELFTASFPCIDLSLAGNRQGIDGQHSGALWPFIELLGEYTGNHGLPKAVLLENVVGLLTSRQGKDLARVIRELNCLGYTADVILVDAKWFVPQSRPRIFVVALRSDDPTMDCLPRLTVDRVRPEAIVRFKRENSQLRLGHITLPEPPEEPVNRLEDLLDDVDPESPLWWCSAQVESLLQNMEEPQQNKVRRLQVGLSDSIGTIYRRVRRGRAVGEIRVDGLAGCLRTPLGGSSIQFLFDARDGGPRIRRMTAREYARLQGADDFPIKVVDRQAMHGFGDAVCVPAVRWLVDSAFGHLLEPDLKVQRRHPVQQRLLEEKERYAVAT